MRSIRYLHEHAARPLDPSLTPSEEILHAIFYACKAVVTFVRGILMLPVIAVMYAIDFAHHVCSQRGGYAVAEGVFRLVRRGSQLATM